MTLAALKPDLVILSSWVVAGAVGAKDVQKVWEGPCWELWVCARQPASGMLRRRMGRSPSTSSSLLRSREKVVGLERDTEDGMSSSEEEGEHSVENFMLCSFLRVQVAPARILTRGRAV